MRILLSAMFLLFTAITQAQEGGTAPAAAAASQPSMMQALMPFAIIFVLFYLLLIRPQKTAQKKHAAMLEALKPGDRVVTKGGLHGTVAQVKEDVLTIKFGEGIKIDVTKSYVEEKKQVSG